ncbi:hypothetical protein CRUP_036013 [Coryphaenoides rupestris]|nr:hypothetical protein CRUP_036013 [Coryphaenoides rupestris]
MGERRREELRLAVDKLRRQILRQSRQYDSQVLQERMELLQQAHQSRPLLFLLLILIDANRALCTGCHGDGEP